jgi:hypothetical protein
MKSFKQYLLESKQVYEFKIKVIDELTTCQLDKLKGALARFSVESFSSGTRTPIQETQVDFPSHKNVAATVYDVVLGYPATSFQIHQMAAETMGLSECCIKVRSMLEEQEIDLNNKFNTASGESLLTKDYENENNQKIVGDAHTMSLLKELGKVKTQGDQYTGVNDSLLAKKSPSEKPASVCTNVGTTSPIGSRQVKLPTANLGKL